MSLARLIREWVALLAILAMALGPLALATSRGLSASERVAVAAGLASLPLCAPGDAMDAMAGKGAGPCDHCLPALEGAKPATSSALTDIRFASALLPADTAPSALLTQLRLPPATGPPVA
jgi:hypothetical protein